MQALEFDPTQHTYRLGGRVVPSVTQILSPLVDFSMIAPGVLEAARIFGQHVHSACDQYNRGTLDWLNLDRALLPYVEAWKAFLADTGAVVLASELRVVHEKLGYAGTPDSVLAWGGRVVIPDEKSTAVVPPTVGPQTAAYAQAYKEMHGGRLPDRYCIQLRPDGTYKTHPRRDPADWSLFLSALNIHKWKVKNRVAA